MKPLYIASFVEAVQRHARGWGLRISRNPDGQLSYAGAVEPERDWNFLDPSFPPSSKAGTRTCI
jgi:hypothetical protein